MSANSRRRGMTLTELSVYCALLTLFSIMLFVNLPTRGNATAEDLRAAAAKADGALERLTLELGNASATSVLQSKSPAGLTFLSASPDGFSPFAYTAAGDVAWRGWVGYYQHDGRLVRVWSPLKSGVSRKEVGATPDPWQILKQGPLQTICEGVSTFSISSPEANLWQIEMTLDVDGSQTTLTTGVRARN